MKKNNYKQKKIIIIGGHEQATNCLEYLIKHKFNVVMCICRKDDNGKDDIFPSLIKKSKELKVQHIRPIDLNSNSLFKKVIKLEPDIIFSLQNNRLINKKWLNYFDKKLGIINIHYSPLPKYAGYWPEMWAIWNEEKSFGVTMHYLSSGIDEGNIIDQIKFKINKNEFREELYKKCSIACFKMLKKNFKNVLLGKVKAVKQDISKRTYYKKHLPNNGFVDIEWSPEKIERFFRAISFRGFVGPKIKIGNKVISTFLEDFPFHEKKYLSNKNIKVHKK